MSEYQHVPQDDHQQELFEQELGMSELELPTVAQNDSGSEDEDQNVASRTSFSLEALHPSIEQLPQLDQHIIQQRKAQEISQSMIEILLVSITLLGWSAYMLHFLGRLWGAWIFVAHLHFRCTLLRRLLSTSAFSPAEIIYPYNIGIAESRNRQVGRALLAVAEIALFAVAYPLVAHMLIETFYRDVDGTIVPEWSSNALQLHLLQMTGWCFALVLFIGILPPFHKRFLHCNFCTQYLFQESRHYSERDSQEGNEEEHEAVLLLPKRIVLRCVGAGFWVLTILHAICMLSFISHWGPWPPLLLISPFRSRSISYGAKSPLCNPLDTTECSLSFPSFHHLEVNPSTRTGYQVHLKGLPPLRGGIPFHPAFLNELDGFSTMAPILFYLDGLKEAHESPHLETSYRLQGPENIAESVTPQSITLLLNVDDSTLVPHWAEIDYLDPDRPMALVIPARPLSHATHYALIVHHATDAHGVTLPATPGMHHLFSKSPASHLAATQTRYLSQVLPALDRAIDWLDLQTAIQHPDWLLANPSSKGAFQFQLVFDFVTASAESQLGPTREVRDSMFAHLDSQDWDWTRQVQKIKEEIFSCSPRETDYPVSRVIHLELTIPSFLRDPYSRYSFLDASRWNNEYAHPKIPMGKARVLLQVPCSLELAAFGQEGGTPVQSFLEFGHGLFYHRKEVQDNFLARLADKNGFLLFALDWRGMSAFDLPIVIRTLMGTPNLFQAVRDNLIQGYANKLAFLHFCKNGLLDWLKLDGRPIPTQNDEMPPTSFYGISQGGILGAGYLAVSGKTDLVDRGVLGVPGTPFSTILTRSLDFTEYDVLLLKNFYYNRHVRILLSLIQMAWDSVEASGLLSPPLTTDESFPPTLLQAGLGDAIVPTSAAEALTRAMSGVRVSNHRQPFDIPLYNNQTSPHAMVTLTELLYEAEYSSLPVDDTVPPGNSVHYCVRLDSALQDQLAEFVRSGKVINPCTEDDCRRDRAFC